MNAKKFYLLIVIAFVMGLIPQGNVSADMGPKPTMAFEFVQEFPGTELSMVSWSLMNCQDNECLNSGAILTSGSGFDCAENKCDAHVYYGVQHDYFQMEITYSDGVTRKSNVFTRRFFDARYRVMIGRDSLFVKELKGSNVNANTLALVFVGGFFFCPATILVVVVTSIVVVVRAVTKKDGVEKITKRLGRVILWALIVDLTFTGLILSAFTFILTLAIESILALTYLWYLKSPAKKILYGVLLANVFTQPIFVLLQAGLSLNTHISTMREITFVELIIWMVETLIVYLVQKGQLSFVKILTLTLVLNAASFGIGLLLPI